MVQDTGDISAVFNLHGRHCYQDGHCAFLISVNLVGAEEFLQDENANSTLILAHDYCGLFSLST
jgi:hypothetical protein